MSVHRGEQAVVAALEAPELAAVAWVMQGLRQAPMPTVPVRPLCDDWRSGPEDVWVYLFSCGMGLGAFTVGEMRRAPCDEGIAVEIDLRSEHDLAHQLRCVVESRAPHGLAALSLSGERADGVRIRAADDADVAAMAELERTVPVHSSGGSTVTVDHGTDYLSHVALMGGNLVVAEDEGRVVAVAGGAVRPVRIGDVERRLLYVHSDRVLPSYRGRGLMLQLAGARYGPAMRVVDGYQGYIDASNEKMVGMARHVWTRSVQRLSFDVSKLARAAPTPRATPDDSARIRGVLDGCHEREAMYRPYTDAELSERLSRVPEAYGWSDLRLTDSAVLGIGRGCERRVRTLADGTVFSSARALVLDYGFVGDAGWADLEGLLRASCAELVERGVSHLTLFTSEGSPGHQALEALADVVEPYRVNCQVPEPDLSSGIYVDHVYF